MKFFHVISSIDKSTGGPAYSVTTLISALLKNSNSTVDLYCGRTSNPLKNRFSSSYGEIHFLPYRWLGKLSGLEEDINYKKPNICHGHGIWQMPCHQMAVSARKLGIPYIITPRGMLDEWSINHKGLKKKIALSLYQRKDLEMASAFHATSILEAKNIRKAGFKNPIAIIPNGIEIPNLLNETTKKGAKKKLLFVSRLVKNKGIEELLIAWSKLGEDIKENWELNILGAGEEKYEKKLKLIKSDLKLTNLYFKGPVYGEAKESYLKEADLFVLPTYTENFGNAVAEALAYGIPVITTKGAPWEELLNTDSGWWIDMGINPLKSVLEEALQISPESLSKMGENGRRLIETKYSIKAVSMQMLELYDYLVNKADKPDFLYDY
ncbi:glycosyltransferase [Gramella sp. BOM4]|nr:glycosyltransferase [Christiangramia bathymodioli]